LTEHLILNVRGGETFCSIDTGKDTIDPYFAGSLAYTGGCWSLGWTGSYGVEDPSVDGAVSSITLRTGLAFRYNLSARISATAAVYYNNADNQGMISSATGSVGSQDSLGLSLGVGYTINQHFAVHVDYSHSSVTSPGSTSESTQGLASAYSRNSFSAGLSFSF
jgi:opacity protein-like surface antigen